MQSQKNEKQFKWLTKNVIGCIFYFVVAYKLNMCF